MRPPPDLLALLAGVQKKRLRQAQVTVPLRTLVSHQNLTLKASWNRVTAELARAADGEITRGLALPEPEQLGLADGRRLVAAVLYNDLRGFSAMVSQNPRRMTLLALQVFVSEMTRVVAFCNGTVVDCAGDRIMGVFWKPAGDKSPQPIHDAVRAAFWMQTVMYKVLNPVLAQHGLPAVSCGIAIDYGSVVVARVGIRNRNKLVFLGDPATFAAKLEPLARDGETILSQVVYENRPPSMTSENNWCFAAEPNISNPAWYRSDRIFKDDRLT